MLKPLRKTVEWHPKPGQSERDLLKKYAGKDGRYCDPDFPCDEASLFGDRDPPEDHIPYANVLWLRPDAYVVGGTPCVFVDEATPGEVVQGKLGDCWFLSALSCVASRRDLLENLFASTEFASKGIYTIRFYKNGKWKHVTIDDRIPCGPTGKPLYGTCRDPRQIWVSLLEKAYAKINGRSYQNLVSGTMTYALKDLTGGDPQVVNLLDPQTADECSNGFLWQKFKLWIKQNNLLGAAWKMPRKDNREEEFDGGIVRGHAYSVMDVREHHDLRFLKLRNPWGMKEWKGRWADDSPEWDDLPADAPDWMVNYTPEDDGIFWMLFEDFIRYFNTVYVCIMFPPSWVQECMKGRFTPECSGGAPDPAANNYWWINPTYRLTLTSKTKTQLFISVAQRDTRMIGNKMTEASSKRDWNSYAHAVGFILARESAVSRCKRTKGTKALRGSDIIAKSSAFKKDRDVSVASFPVVLEPQGGPYVLIPMTFEAQAELKYYVTVRSNKHVKLEEYNVPDQAEEDGDDEDEDEDQNKAFESAVPRDEDDVEAASKQPVEPTQAEAIAMCKMQPPVETVWVVDEGSGMKFVDHIFIASEYPAIRMDKDPKRSKLNVSKWTSAIEWRRPANIDLASYMGARGPSAAPIKPTLFKQGNQLPGDVEQGALPNTWFLGAASAVATRPDLLQSLFVDYSPNCENHGVYTVRLYKDGIWHNVIIDDQLPVTTDGQFLFSRCKDPSELWLPLLEKAYAKLHGCYECLMQGSVPLVMQDLTAGAPQIIKFTEPDVDFRIKNGVLWREMDALLHGGSLLTVQLREEGKKAGKEGASNKMGLLTPHAYTVLELREFDLKRMGLERFREEWTLRLVKLRNPWGKGDFTGPWGPKSELWRGKYELIAKECHFRDFETGSFWMPANDFFTKFNTLNVCRIFKTPDPWRALRFQDAWRKTVPDAAGVISPKELELDNAMGPPDRKNPSAWLKNPQFLVFVKEKTPCLMVLSQKDSRVIGGAQAAIRTKGGAVLDQFGKYDKEIGFAVARAAVVREKGSRMKKSDFFAIARFRRDRDVSTPYTLQLSPKDSPYVIFAMTSDPGMVGGFALNLYVKADVFVRGGERIEVLEHEHDDSDDDVDAFDHEAVEGMEEAVAGNPDSLPGASGRSGA